jgi:hypothetical protein
VNFRHRSLNVSCLRAIYLNRVNALWVAVVSIGFYSFVKMSVLFDMDMLRHDSNNHTEDLLCVLRNDTGKPKAVLVLKFV